MKKTVRTVPFPQACRHFFFACVFVALSGPLLHAEEIHIRVLNGQNGRPITNECLNVSLGQWHGADLIAPTNGEGVVVLHLGDGGVAADPVSPRVCNGTASVGPKPLARGADSIAVAGDVYFACQEYGKIIPGEAATPNLPGRMMPSYSIKGILESGISASNTCGRSRVKAKPGELILFVRPLHWWERMKQ